ncbi:MAG: ribonuclease III [Lachnospiraceae bacterium]|nr:ribonuclease III [Lachnospiraceae bacterium]MCR5477191.1 ribonuclease III [Lachnospiraceae bacterium]
MHRNDLEELQERIGYRFRDVGLLQRALTHSSFNNEQKIRKLGDYERTEFLGDAVLELISSDFLFREDPDRPEGELTKLRASLVCEPTLAYCARELELQEYIRMSRGEEMTGGRRKDSIISDVLEAVIGAIYLDASAQGGQAAGLEQAGAFIRAFILSDYEHKVLFHDSKTALQEYLQAQEDRKEFHYEILSEEGPEHDRQYVAGFFLGGEQFTTGTGHSKKIAEQRAAYEALLLLRVR